MDEEGRGHDALTAAADPCGVNGPKNMWPLLLLQVRLILSFPEPIGEDVPGAPHLLGDPLHGLGFEEVGSLQPPDAVRNRA